MSYRDQAEVDVLYWQRISAGTLQEREIGIVLLDGLVNTAHGLHRLHSTRNHHGTTYTNTPKHQLQDMAASGRKSGQSFSHYHITHMPNSLDSKPAT